ncbi:BamA/OMP85 family outer membrane protein [Aliterella atlantica]|uniref:Surface antigen (D15) n=1 Tax=Aliterella atlantica CENA595 TaxID=1618023 RepID=A0A0D8ZN21_9CYAN|nr:outer membrane protein assembly factor [Aliterella atlantica]KJH69864.1 surface antigen (D15) [Aliterella atlantica CENA595]
MRVSSTAIWTLAAIVTFDLSWVEISAAQNLPTIPQITAQEQTPQSDRSTDVFVLTTDVQIVGASEELAALIRDTIKTRAGEDTSDRQLQADVQAILATGLFANARVNTTSNPAGINVGYEVEPIVIQSLQLANAQVLTPEVATKLFQPQLGNAISPSAISQSADKIKQWYIRNGYIAAKVISVSPSPEGILTIDVSEGIVNSVSFRFLNRDGKPTNDRGEPILGRTKQEFLRREVKIQPGDVLSDRAIEEDLRQLYRTGLFRTVNVVLQNAPNQVDVIYDLTEKPTRNIGGGGGYDDDTGIYVELDYQDFNFGGINDSVGIDVQASRRELQFATNFTSPYRASEPNRLGYQITAFRRRGTSQTFDGIIDLANGSNPREGRFGGGISVQRPINDWQASLGFNYTRVSIRDRDGNISPTDELGNPLSFSGTGIDDILALSFSATKDDRNDPKNPTQGSVISFSTEQSIPFGEGNIAMNRLQANYIQYIPVEILGTSDREVLAFNLQGGTTIGDLPPYQAFNLGGLNSVRAYGEGEVGSGRSYVLASAEYRFPIFRPVGGVIFADFASDLGSGDTVLGEPAVVRSKPGSGFSYGAGLRIESPIGLLRADFGINNRGESQVQFGIGQRF